MSRLHTRPSRLPVTTLFIMGPSTPGVNGSSERPAARRNLATAPLSDPETVPASARSLIQAYGIRRGETPRDRSVEFHGLHGLDLVVVDWPHDVEGGDT